jgi:hypothetical protein
MTASHLPGQSSVLPWMSAKGHEDAFPRPRLSARYRFSQGTFAGTRGNGRDAPISALRGTAIEPQGSTLNRPHGLASTSQVAVPAAAGRCARILNFIKALCGARSIGIH